MVEQKPSFSPKNTKELDINVAVKGVLRKAERKRNRDKFSGHKESKLSPVSNAYVESADAASLSLLKKFPRRARHALRLATQKGALTAAGLSFLISSGCGNVEKQNTPPSATPTPAVSELPTGMPSATIELTEISPSTPQPAGERQFRPDLVFTGETRKFEGETAKIVEGVEKDFGVKIVSPLTWEENGEVKKNLSWSMRDIALVAESVSQLPPEYRTSERSPREILLLRSRESTSEGAGGGYASGYASRRLILFTSEAFSSDEKLHSYAGELYGYQRNHLRATVHHEYTHSFTEAYPEIEQLWIDKIGWRKDTSGNWVNDRPQHLIPDGGADKNPVEDIAVSTALMLVNPNILSTDRRDFFLTNEHYNSWPTVQTFKQNK